MSSSFKNPNQKPRQFSRSGTFADLLMRHLRAKGGDAPAVYTAARIDRRTYSSIISHPFRQVSKRTAVQFALALRLDRKAADELLLAAGFALSPVIPEDVEQGGQRLVSFQSAANRLRVKIAHESLLPFRFKSDILTRYGGKEK